MSETHASYATIIRYEPEGNGTPDYLALHPEIDGCFAQGDTPAEAVENLAEVTEMILTHLRESGLPVPAPNLLLRDAPSKLYWVGADAPHTVTEYAPVVGGR